MGRNYFVYFTYLKGRNKCGTKSGIQRYSEVLNTYSYTNLTSFKEIFNIVFKKGTDVALVCKFEPRCF